MPEMGGSVTMGNHDTKLDWRHRKFSRRQRNHRKPLSKDEIVAAFSSDDRFPPLLSLEQASELSHYAPGTIKRLVSEGFFCNSVKRNKPVLFWRDRFVQEVMEMNAARERQKNSNSQKGGD